MPIKTRNEKIVSVSIYLGQVSKSTDINRIDKANDITMGLICNKKRIFINTINEKNIKMRFRITKENCHSVPKINFVKEIRTTGIVYI